MIKKKVKIEGIPAIIWGTQSKRVFVAVHGNMSHKEDLVIELLARQATENGCQVISFDLPEHGEHRSRSDINRVETYINVLKTVMWEVQNRWNKVSLFACSMGAYFSLLAYKDIPFEKVLFLSPVTNMQDIIEGVMENFNISEKQLQKEETIETPTGMKLYWPYYQYVITHPISSWDHPTYILYGGQDQLCSRNRIQEFADQFHCKLKINESAEHYFHTKEQLEAYVRWLDATV